MNRALLAAYREACDADERFSAELRRAYGDDAGDARYKRRHADARVQAAAEAFQRAAEAYDAAMSDARRCVNADGWTE